MSRLVPERRRAEQNPGDGGLMLSNISFDTDTAAAEHAARARLRGAGQLERYPFA